MEIRQTYKLTEKQITEISALVESCSQDGRPLLSFPFEDGTSFYLLYDPALVCALALTMPEPEDQAAGAAAECSAFTHPDFRRRGYFTALFERAGDEFQDTDLLFPVNPACEDTRKTLEALGAEFDVDELRMDLDLEQMKLERPEAECPDSYRPDSGCLNFGCLDFNCPDSNCLNSGFLKLSVSSEDNSSSDTVCDETEDFIFHFELDIDWLAAAGYEKLQDAAAADKAAETGNAPKAIDAGTCRTTIFDRHAGTACLYAFEIVPELRGRGIGKKALCLILRFLKEQGVKLLFLQVSGDNTAALNLYKKAGFRITETLSYYFY